jgi:hypothetical protein
LRSKFMVMATKTPSDKANNITTLIANFAAWGCPAPSSLETRVLHDGNNNNGNCSFKIDKNSCANEEQNFTASNLSAVPYGNTKTHRYREKQLPGVKAASNDLFGIDVYRAKECKY